MTLNYWLQSYFLLQALSSEQAGHLDMPPFYEWLEISANSFMLECGKIEEKTLPSIEIVQYVLCMLPSPASNVNIDFAHPMNKIWIGRIFSRMGLLKTDNQFEQSKDCVTRSPLLFLRSWVALSFKVCEWVKHRCHPTKSPSFFQYTKASMPYTDLMLSRINHYHLILTQY